MHIVGSTPAVFGSQTAQRGLSIISIPPPRTIPVRSESASLSTPTRTALITGSGGGGERGERRGGCVVDLPAAIAAVVYSTQCLYERCLQPATQGDSQLVRSSQDEASHSGTPPHSKRRSRGSNQQPSAYQPTRSTS